MPFFKIKATIEAFTTYTVEAADEDEAIKKWENDEARANGDLETDHYATEEFEDCTQLTPEQETRERAYLERMNELRTQTKQLKLQPDKA